MLLVTEGLGDGLKLSSNIVVPFGCSTTGITFCTPNEFLRLPDICLNFGTLNSAKDNISTKKAISSVAISAKVDIHAGAPLTHSSHSSHSSSSSKGAASASAIFISYYLISRSLSCF